MYEQASNPQPDPVWSIDYTSDMGIPLYAPLQTNRSATEFGGAKLGCASCEGSCGIKGLGEDESSFDLHNGMDLLFYGIAGYAIFTLFAGKVTEGKKKGEKLKRARTQFEKAKADAGVFGGIFG